MLKIENETTSFACVLGLALVQELHVESETENEKHTLGQNQKIKFPFLIREKIKLQAKNIIIPEKVETLLNPPFVFNQGNNGAGCDCVLGCNDCCFCAMKNGGGFAYDHNGYLLRGKPVIFECEAFCQCPPNCRNRVSQGGLRNRSEVFRSRKTGWGVKS